MSGFLLQIDLTPASRAATSRCCNVTAQWTASASQRLLRPPTTAPCWSGTRPSDMAEHMTNNRMAAKPTLIRNMAVSILHGLSVHKRQQGFFFLIVLHAIFLFLFLPRIEHFQGIKLFPQRL